MNGSESLNVKSNSENKQVIDSKDLIPYLFHGLVPIQTVFNTLLLMTRIVTNATMTNGMFMKIIVQDVLTL